MDFSFRSLLAYGAVMIIFLSLVLLSFVLYLQKKYTLKKPNHSICVIMGSGGHSGEMLSFLKSLVNFSVRESQVSDSEEPHNQHFVKRSVNFSDIFGSRIYLYAKEDQNSHDRAQLFEDAHFGPKQKEYVRIGIPRSRQVGQSYITSIFTTLNAFAKTFFLVGDLYPAIIVCNGPGTCVPIIVSALILNKVLGRKTKLIYFESFACVTHLSVSGKLLYPIVDTFLVQWKELLSQYPHASYIGRLESFSAKKLVTKKTGVVFVTVGTTKFEALIEALDQEEITKILKQKGYNEIRIQFGSGKKPENILASKWMEASAFSLKPSIAEDIEQAELIISHAGAASTLEGLSKKKKMLLVPNELLMNNHQLQLAQVMSEKKFTFSARVKSLAEDLKKIDETELHEFPPEESDLFSIIMFSSVGESKKKI